MGLMDRDYMNRTPEEREAEYKSKMSEEHKHEQRKADNSSIVPIVIFIVVLIFIILTFYFNPDLANFNIWN